MSQMWHATYCSLLACCMLFFLSFPHAQSSALSLWSILTCYCFPSTSVSNAPPPPRLAFPSATTQTSDSNISTCASSGSPSTAYVVRPAIPYSLCTRCPSILIGKLSTHLNRNNSMCTYVSVCKYIYVCKNIVFHPVPAVATVYCGCTRSAIQLCGIYFYVALGSVWCGVHGVACKSSCVRACCDFLSTRRNIKLHHHQRCIQCTISRQSDSASVCSATVWRARLWGYEYLPVWIVLFQYIHPTIRSWVCEVT